MPKRLSLSEARDKGKLKQFIAQEEKRVPLADEGAFDALLEKALRAPRSKRQTSRSQARAGSRGK